MRKTQLKLLAMLAASLFLVAACGDDDTGSGDDDTTQTDTTDTSDNDTEDTTSDEDTGSVDTDTTPPDDTVCDCGTRECGTFAGCDCGTCAVGESCNASGRCEAPGAPMGSYCGDTATCNSNTPDYPNCINDQCASRNCLSANGAVALLKDVCSQGCQIYQDNDANGVNDADASLSDCNPADIVSGPAGNSFRCVNFAGPGATPLGLCAPGSEFAECSSNADCPAGEGCDLTSIGGDFNFRCVAQNQAGDWGDVVGLSESCNGDPAAGPVTLCESGLCFGLGCVSPCSADSQCDTTQVYANTGCVNGTCEGKPGISCSADIDCSFWECGEGRQILGDGQGGLAGPFWEFCWPKGCEVDNDCGAGSYCRFFWDGVVGPEAGLENSCLAQNPDGVDLGEACDPNPDDNIPGNVCKNEDLCVGGFCSAICAADSDCATDQVCGIVELNGTEDAEGNLEFVLPVGLCQTLQDPTTDCLADADCTDTEVCTIYEVAATSDVDAPYQLAGKCTSFDAATFPGDTGKWGQLCNGGDECRSGFCLGATEQSAGFCTKLCSASSECETVDVGGEAANGVCNSFLFAFAGNLEEPRTNLYLPLCEATLSSTEDCSDDFTCDDPSEVCFPNVVATDATRPAMTEWLCQVAVAEGDPAPTKQIGEACDIESDAVECVSALCLDDGAGGGYCSAPCDAEAAVDTCAAANMACSDFPTIPFFKGAYEAHSGSFSICRQDLACTTCVSDASCTGNRSCVNLGGIGDNADFRCVDACTADAECTGAQSTCNAGENAFGDAVMGCFDQSGAAPTNHCAAP